MVEIVKQNLVEFIEHFGQNRFGEKGLNRIWEGFPLMKYNLNRIGCELKNIRAVAHFTLETLHKC